MQNSIFNFPDYFYSSLRCSKDSFDKVWNDIPKYNKHNINMWAAVSMVCIKLSDDLFYKDFDKLFGVMDIDYDYPARANEILMDVDDLFSGAIYEGYRKIIQEQKEHHIKVYSAEEVLNRLEHQFINKDSVSFDIFSVNKISVIIGYSHKKYIESRYTLIRDMLSELGWFMSMKDDVVKKHDKYDFPGYIELVFEPIQIPSATVDIRRDNKKVYHITLTKNLPSIKRNGLSPKNENDSVIYSESRIYFLKEKTMKNSFKKTMETICSQKGMKKGTLKMSCLEINVSKIPDNVEFYYDTHEQYGLYATDTIPFSAVEHIYKLTSDAQMEEIDIDKDIDYSTILEKIYRLVKKVFSLS